MDISGLQTTLDQKRQELARLEVELKTAQEQRLPNLAQENGFESVDDLIVALSKFASLGLKNAIQNALQGSGNAQAAPKSRRRRARMTPELRARISDALRKGTKTARQIAADFDVSASFVNTYKRTLGMTRKRLVRAR